MSQPISQNTTNNSLGELCPVGGGDNIPLHKPKITIGRRTGSDICLRFPNVSSTHCELEFQNGYWHVVDLNSRNGLKINGIRCLEKFLMPGDILHVADHRYTINYQPQSETPPEEDVQEVFSVSLMEKAGLERKRPKKRPVEDLASELPNPSASKAPLRPSTPDDNDDVMKWLMGD